MLVLLKESESLYAGDENPNAKAEKVTVAPGAMSPVGTGVVRMTVAGVLDAAFCEAADEAPFTVIVTFALEEFPAASEAETVSLCEPESDEDGVQLKLPEELIFELLTVLPVKESLTE